MILKITVEPEEATDDNVTPKNECLLSLITARQFCPIASLVTPVHSETRAAVRSEILGTFFI